jgi:S-adenosylmethionine-diacylgycerolhomoserine-N-methlytransferase
MSDNAHVDFLDRYYGRVHGIYDVTRKYYLLGRDALLAEIATQQPRTVIEVGCGTGRNLARLRRAHPDARYGAIEPCASMREHALERHPWITMCDRTAEEADIAGLLGERPDVIFFSYALSMIEDSALAIERCQRALAPHGRLYVLDFGDLSGLGGLGRTLFRRWLTAFHVHPERLQPVWNRAHALDVGGLSYWKRACLRALPSESPEQEAAAARHPVQ